MSYRSLALATAVAASSWMLIASAAAQSVYVAPGGVYVAPGAGPVYVTPAGPINRPAAYVGPGPAYGGTAAYVDTDYDDGYASVGYVEPTYGYGYGPDVYVEPSYGYGYGPRPYLAPRYGYAYRPGVNRRYYGARAAYASTLPLRPRVAVPYRRGRCVGRFC
jgi:hypothetical protein